MVSYKKAKKRLLAQIEDIPEGYLASQVLGELTSLLEENKTELAFTPEVDKALEKNIYSFSHTAHADNYTKEYANIYREIQHLLQLLQIKCRRGQGVNIQKNYKHIKKFIAIADELHSKFDYVRKTRNKVDEKKKEIQKEIDSLVEQHHFGSDMLKNQDLSGMRELKKQIEYLEELDAPIEKTLALIEEFSKVHKTFYSSTVQDKESLERTLHTAQENIQPLVDELKQLKDPLHHNNQDIIGRRIEKILKMTNNSYYHYEGRYNHEVYTNIANLESGDLHKKRPFSNSGKNHHKRIGPKKFAKVLENLHKNGLQSSGRGLRDPIGGVINFRNIFFYFEELFYGDEDHVMLEWVPDDFAVFTYTHGVMGRKEGLVFYEKRFYKPKHMKIIIRDPQDAKSHKDKEFIEQLMAELRKRAVPYEIKK